MKARLLYSFVFLFLIFSLPAYPEIAVNVNDRVRLRATHPTGVPVHKVPRRTNDFRRVPEGTEATLQQLAREGRWLRLRFDDHSTGWITTQYVGRNLTQNPVPTEPPPENAGDLKALWRDPASCREVVNQGRRLPKEDPKALRVGTWNIRWFPDGCSQAEECEGNATDIDWLACTIAWMGIDVLAVQEILDSLPARVQLATLTQRLNALGAGAWENDLQDCGPPKSQHVGFLWNSDKVALEHFTDVAEMNGASRNGAACASNLRPGRYARVTSKQPDGVDFQLISVHFDSGTSHRDYQHRRLAAARIPSLQVGGTPILALDQDVVVLGDFNTMGRREPPEIEAAREIEIFDGEVAPGFRRLNAAPFCTEYFDGKPGALDHIVVSAGMQESSGSAQVSGYCAVLGCGAVSGTMPAAYERLSDHCPVVFEVKDQDLD